MAGRDLSRELFGAPTEEENRPEGRDLSAELFGDLAPKGESGFIPSIKRGGRGIASLATDIIPAMVA